MDPNKVAAYFDHSGLYAFGRQPEAVYWNVQQLARALVTIVGSRRHHRALQGLQQSLSDAVEDRLLQAAWAWRRPGAGARSALPAKPAVNASHARPSPWTTPCTVRLGGENGPQGDAWDDVRAAQATFEPVALTAGSTLFSNSAACSLAYDEIEALWAPIAEQR